MCNIQNSLLANDACSNYVINRQIILKF